MIQPTPGIRYLARGLGYLSIPFISLTVLGHQLDDEIPIWLLVIGSLLTIPVYGAIKVIWTEIRHRREAVAMGARMVPRVPGKWPGNLDTLVDLMYNFNYGYPGDGLDVLLEKYGTTINMRILWDDLILTTEPNNIKSILATDFNNYVKGERFQEKMNSVLGTGVFNSDGEMWKFHRSMTRPFFTRDRISHFELFDRHAEHVVQLIKRRMRDGYAIDFQDLVSRFAMDSATEFLFGKNVDSLSAILPYPDNIYPNPSRQTASGTQNIASEFSRAFSEAMFIAGKRERLGVTWPLFEIFKDLSKEPVKVVNAYLDPVIKEAIEKQRQTPAALDKQALEVAEGETVLDHLVKLTSDPKTLKDETLNILLAGRDTTSATLTFIVFFLSMYPSVMNRLREEILAKVGRTRRPDYDDIRDMKYLRAVINETMRLYPVSSGFRPFNVRESVQATTWPSPTPGEKPLYIPAGSRIPYSVLLMHRRTDLWGPDALEFDPDRFLDERLKKYVGANPFIFLPFNAGPRICLGQQFAYNEMSFMIIRLLQNFSSFTLDPQSQPAGTRPPTEWAKAEGRKATDAFYPKCHLTMYSNGGLWVKMQESDSAGEKAD